jgi:hypothetical protein
MGTLLRFCQEQNSNKIDCGGAEVTEEHFDPGDAKDTRRTRRGRCRLRRLRLLRDVPKGILSASHHSFPTPGQAGTYSATAPAVKIWVPTFVGMVMSRERLTPR